MDPRTRPEDDLFDVIAAYVVDAVDDDERLAIEATLLGDPVADAAAVVLRDVTVAYGEAGIGSVEAPAGLRDRVLRAAFDRRPAVPVSPADARDAHAVEGERAELLFARLTDAHLVATLDAPEFAGWTVRELVVHLSANETLLAQALGVPIDVPETTHDNDRRTAEALERHRDAALDGAIAEHRAARLAVDAAVRARTDEQLDEPIGWWDDVPIGIRTVLVLRAFETWTHADDIRRAIGTTAAPPPASILLRMSTLGTELAPITIAAAGLDVTERTLALDLTGEGGGRFLIDLTGAGRDLAGVEPDATIVMDVIAFCHALGKRAYLYDDALPFTATGDLTLASAYVDTLDSLAVL